MTHRTFGQRLGEQFAQGRRLCVGIDPHSFALEKWSLPDSAAGAEEFGNRIIDAAHGRAAAVKPQIAFFERYGAAGFHVLERLLERARSSNLLVIADVKRGDVGSSFDAYADAWLRAGSPLEADAMTVNPYQGFGVLARALEYCDTGNKGLFVLAATSNPEALEIQSARLTSGETVSAHILRAIDHANVESSERHDQSVERERQSHPPERQTHTSVTQHVGNVGAVLGATLNLEHLGIDIQQQPDGVPVMPVLVPGFGHQGGSVEAVQRSFGRFLSGMLVSESRSLYEGNLESLSSRIQQRSDELAAALVEE